MRAGAAWTALVLLLSADVALAQFRPLRFDDNFAVQREDCDRAQHHGACWKDRQITDHLRLSIGGDLRLRYDARRLGS